MSEPQLATSSTNRQCRKRLIVTGDDFGLNSEVNETIERYHQAGLLTQASLMVNESGVDEALRIAQRNPKLTVGLHLTLCCGLASRVSSLTDSQRRLSPSPAISGLRYAFDFRLAAALREEITAQFQKFRSLALPPIYWDGHTHLHLHPTVFNLTLPIAQSEGFRATRLVREPSWEVLPVIFRLLSGTAQRRLTRKGMRFVDRVHGLRQTGQMTTHSFERLLLDLRKGWNEIYFHPGAEPMDLDCQLLTELIALEEICLTSTSELIITSLPSKA